VENWESNESGPAERSLEMRSAMVSLACTVSLIEMLLKPLLSGRLLAAKRSAVVVLNLALIAMVVIRY